MLARFAKEVYLNFEEAAHKLSSRTQWRVLDNPVRPGFTLVDREEAVKYWALNPDLPTLLITGGSQGAMRINNAVHDSLSELSHLCNLIWSRGKVDTKEPQDWDGPGKLIVKPFIDEMSQAYAAADLAVCRSGAMTLSELKASALPAILIPYPYAAANHQWHNAEAFAARGGACVVNNDDLNGKRLVKEVSDLLGTTGRIDKMRHALKKMPVMDSANIIAQQLLNINTTP